MTRTGRRVVATGGTFVVTAVALVALAPPAAAHGIGGTQPTNYETSVTRVAPATRGVRVEAVDLGTRLRLTNDASSDVVVLGYDGEPYLRVGPRGVYENVRSPATYLNRSIDELTTPPASADPRARPEWRRVSGGDVASWHDHRAHWMGNEAPPQVQRDPDRRHVIERWVVPLRVDGHPAEVRGVLAWEPPPSPWPAVALAVGLAAVVVALGRSRHWRTVLVVALAALAGSSAAHTAGHWAGSTAGLGSALVEILYGIVGVALGVGALAWAARRGVGAAVPLVLVAAVFLLVATGLGDLATIGHSQVPSVLPADVARLAVTVTIGLGAGLAVAAALRLRSSAAAPGSARPRDGTLREAPAVTS